ncbi:MAG: hypothetical protein OXE86_09380 [Alphaproteobacteria bacterium]|nr:hypothetical protein [Alphaproteobacteria bacterium]
MSATIVPFGPRLHTPIGHVIRTGEMSHRQYEYLHAEGRLPAKHVIVDASRARFQKEFIRALRDDGADVILDTKAAELSEVGRFRGMAKSAPWAATEEDRPLNPGDFQLSANTDLFGQMARMAVELGITAVMAPTHFLRNGANDPWLPIDGAGVMRLRSALDREGGAAIAIDYPLILPHTRLQDRTDRARLIQALDGLPFDNLILRLSGFGSNAMPGTVKGTFIAIEALHGLGRPVLLDHVGGLVGLSALAFGIVSGIAHGIGEREQFSARDWHKHPKEREKGASFGRPIYVPLFGLDKTFRVKDLKAIASAPGGRRLISCPDRECCPRGLESMLQNPRAHIARQQFAMIDHLGSVPDTRRIGHFFDVDLRGAERTARDLARLNTGNEKLSGALVAGRNRIDRMAGMYETLAERERGTPLPMRRRNASGAASGHGAP